MVRRRVEIKPIQENSKRHTTFTKRRKGLEKKTSDLGKLCDAEATVITFSKAGNAYSFGYPNVDQVLDRYRGDSTSSSGEKDADNGVEERVHGGEKEEEAPPLTEVEKRIGAALANGRLAWDVMVKDLGWAELDELEAAIRKIKSTVAARAREMTASGCRGNTPEEN